MKNPKVVIVMPAYNAARTVKDTYSEIPKKFRENIILVDDCSKDNTVEVAKKFNINLWRFLVSYPSMEVRVIIGR